MQEEQYRKEEGHFLSCHTNMSLPQTPNQSFKMEPLENYHCFVTKCAVWLALIDSEHAVMARAARVEKIKLCFVSREELDIIDIQSPSPQSPLPFSIDAKQPSVCEWVGAV